MRVYVCRRDLHSAKDAARRLTQIGHRITACTTSQQISIPLLMESGADVFLLDRYMPHPDGMSLKKALLPRNCILIDADLDAAINELEALSCGAVEPAVQQHLWNELLQLGFRPHTRGARQTLNALCRILRDERALLDLRHRVYEHIAREEGCTWQSVERNIRYAVESVWTRGNLTMLQSRFGETIEAERGKPTNKAFLAQIAEHIRLQGRHTSP